MDCEWIQKHPGWYERFLGAQAVSTNNYFGGSQRLNQDIQENNTGSEPRIFSHSTFEQIDDCTHE